MGSAENKPLHQPPEASNSTSPLLSCRRSSSAIEDLPSSILIPKLHQLATHPQLKSQARPTTVEDWEVIERSASAPSIMQRSSIRYQGRGRRDYCPSESASSLASFGIAPSVVPSTDVSDFGVSFSSPEIIDRPGSMESWDQGPRLTTPSLASSSEVLLPLFDRALEAAVRKIEGAGSKITKGAKSVIKNLGKGAGKMAWRIGRGSKLRRRAKKAACQSDGTKAIQSAVMTRAVSI